MAADTNTRSDSLLRRLKDHPLVAVVVVASVIIVGIANFGKAVETIASWSFRRTNAPQLILRIREPRFTLDSVFLPTYVFNATTTTWRITNATLSDVPRDFETMDPPGYENLRGRFDTVVVEPGKTVSFIVRAASPLLYWEGWCGLNPRVAVEYEFLGSELRSLHGDPIAVARLTPSRYAGIVEFRQSVATLEIPSTRLSEGFEEGSLPIVVDSAATDMKRQAAIVAAAYRRLRRSLHGARAQLADSCSAVIKSGAQRRIGSNPATRALPYYLIRSYPRWKNP